MSPVTFAGLTVVAAALLAPTAARAHFILQTPASWAEQGGLGDPQKSAPCGQADPGVVAVATGMVTSFAPGDPVTITINETVAHPGHYRVALSTTGQAGLPADPVVTPVGNDPCGSTVIQNPPVFPILADGMLMHTAAFSAPQTFTVTLPTGMTCTNCTLQVLEFMSSHGAPCFYHHCANITIQAAGTGGTGAGGTGAGGSTGAGGTTGTGLSSSGCGCAVGALPTSLGAWLLIVAIVVARRRRAR